MGEEVGGKIDEVRDGGRKEAGGPSRRPSSGSECSAAAGKGKIWGNSSCSGASVQLSERGEQDDLGELRVRRHPGAWRGTRGAMAGAAHSGAVRPAQRGMAAAAAAAAPCGSFAHQERWVSKVTPDERAASAAPMWVLLCGIAPKQSTKKALGHVPVLGTSISPAVEKPSGSALEEARKTAGHSRARHWRVVGSARRGGRHLFRQSNPVPGCSATTWCSKGGSGEYQDWMRSNSSHRMSAYPRPRLDYVEVGYSLDDQAEGHTRAHYATEVDKQTTPTKKKQDEN
ncbi:hypothetical protein PWT90_05631 [Aphanocladium album]|nr:hypothetical protein PWT90_05631 [Aphanocladium album]